MRILAIEREQSAPPTGDLADAYRAEAGAVWDLVKRDVIRDIWFTPGRHAVVMLECQNAADARRHLATLPLVRSGLIDFTLHELRNYDGFERLFATGARPVAPKPEAPAEY